jgi:hypothetical protein
MHIIHRWNIIGYESTLKVVFGFFGDGTPGERFLQKCRICGKTRKVSLNLCMPNKYMKKEYDYIIVDTPPVSLVTDTLLIAKNADAFIYVIRANYLDKRMLGFIEDLYQQKKLPNLSLILNDTDLKKSYGYAYGYGYGYGYGMEIENKSWKDKFFKRK